MVTGRDQIYTMSEGPTSLLSCHGARVMIVDDEATAIDHLERILKKEGYEHLENVRNPRLILERQAEFRPDLIVLDVRMPGLDGFQVLEKLAKVRREAFLPVLATTGLSDKAARLRALAAGAHDVITKPFEDAEVASRVHNLVQLRFLYEEQCASRLYAEQLVAERTANRAGIICHAINPTSDSLQRGLESASTTGAGGTVSRRRLAGAFAGIRDVDVHPPVVDELTKLATTAPGTRPT